MATVGITKELRDRVKSVISKMEYKEIRADVPELEKTYTMDASYLYHYGCWGKEHMHLIHEIPHDWLGKVTESNITVKGVMDDGLTVLSCNVRFNGMNAFSRPKEGYYNRTESIIELHDLQAMPEVVLGRAELLKRWEDAAVAKEISDRWVKVKNDIDDFLKKCKTLNEAVKLFPNVRLYIDGDDLERLDRKVERLTQRKKIVETMATDELTAAAIASKLMGAI